jgi:hypothetical protein
VQGLELRVSVQDVSLANVSADAGMLVEHLEQLEVARLGSLTAHVRTLAETLQLGQMPSGSASQMSLGRCGEFLRGCAATAAGVDNLHEVVAEIHGCECELYDEKLLRNKKSCTVICIDSIMISHEVRVDELHEVVADVQGSKEYKI